MSDKFLTKDQMLDFVKSNVSATVKDVIEASLAKGFESRMPEMVKAAAAAQAQAIEEAKPHKALAGRYLQAVALARGDVKQAMELAKTHFSDARVAKALSESVFTDGGFMVPQAVAAQIDAVLRSKSVYRQAGPVSVPLPNGSLTMRYGNNGSVAYFVGENEDATTTSMDGATLEMKARKLMLVMAISNDLLQDAGEAAAMFIEDDAVRAINDREQNALIRGDGTSNTPRGLLYLVDAANKFGITKASTNATLAEMTADLARAILAIEDGNIDIERGHWFFANRTKLRLMTVRDGNGNLAFGDEMKGGTLFGYKFAASTAIPKNLGVAGDESEIYLADMSKMLLGETGGFSLEKVVGAAYHDGSSVVSGLSRDQTVLVGRKRIDHAARFRGKEIAVLTAVDWVIE